MSPKIVSLLPAATEMACALGLEENLVGISFECDYPRAIADRPHVVNTVIEACDKSPGEIDADVTQVMRDAGSLYIIDEPLLESLRPDLILAQDLCQVCAPSGNELSQTLARLDYTPEVIFMSPHSLADIEGNLMELAAATGTTALAEEIIAGWRRRVEAVKERVASAPRRRVFVMEWVDPIYCSGHWLPEMVSIAGGEDALAKPGADSIRIEWKQVLDWQPEVLIIAPCGYNQEQAEKQIKLLKTLPGWDTLPAVKSGRIYPVDANAYFVRPGPRVIEGIEMLEKLIHG